MTCAVLTIAIPTWNRAPLVETAIRSLMAQENGSCRWKVLVVDNASSDDTAARLEKARCDWSRLSTVGEETRGLSYARNRAVEECGTEYLLFADDESKFPADYVDRALDIIDRYAPVLFGGPIYPWYTEPPPSWWSDEYGSFSLPRRLGRADRIYFSGGNVGYAVEALRAVGGFDTNLGMRGSVLRFGEETAVEQALLRRYPPETVHYDPLFFNYHMVRPEKYRWRFLMRENFARGLARARVARSAAEKSADDGPREIVPACLRPTAVPPSRSSGRTFPRVAYEIGLPLLRRFGYAMGRLFRR